MYIYICMYILYCSVTVTIILLLIDLYSLDALA